MLHFVTATRPVRVLLYGAVQISTQLDVLLHIKGHVLPSPVYLIVGGIYTSIEVYIICCDDSR
jgi:hypothetical protein